MFGHLPRLTALLLVSMVAPPLQAQIKPAPAPTATRAVTLPAPVRTPPNAATPADNDSRIRERLATHPIGDGDSAAAAAIVPPSAPLRVYDSKGQLLNGMKAAGPNRVLDTRTGRYHDTVPSADGQRIVR